MNASRRRALAVLLGPLLLLPSACGPGKPDANAGATSAKPRPVAPSSSAAPSPAASAGPHVKLIVQSTDGKPVFIAYELGAGAPIQQANNAKTPWTFAADLAPDYNLVDMTVTGAKPKSGLTCVIILDNEVVAQNSAFGAVNCHYVSPS